ncbi:glycosyltransferase family 4 protein [Paraneptunicella aestuarii]|uniref:glycosyltransferase family 4 protein n=1 Tax=Paraneptunicella aestuarii TaxID=2831148 RepID=UPI001E5801BC|nr:glycosyltransferase family 4 protein [Paraneptunicella aestuarii]UAA39821.1 glycosyltransferase family 4 protein [Paraneptunicella aestuarii]
MNKTINIIAGASTDSQGNAAHLIQHYINSALCEKNNILFITTHSSDSSLPGTIFRFNSGLTQLLWLGIRYQLGWLHLHLDLNFSFMRTKLIVTLAKQLGAQIILHLHNDAFADFYDAQSPKKQRKISRLFNQADKIIAASRQIARRIEVITGKQDNIQVLFNSVPHFNTPKPTPPVKPQSILFLNPITEYKTEYTAVFDLLVAFAQLLPEHPQATLKIGEMTKNEETEKLKVQINKLGVEKSITLLGKLTEEQKNYELAQADIFCLPVYKESSSTNLLKAMSAGKAIITTPVGYIPEIIFPDKNGLLFTSGDIASLHKCLSNLITDDKNKQALCKAAQRDFAEKLSESVMFKQLQTIYDSLGKHRE